MENAIETTIDQAGRLVIPKPMREQAGLQPGMPLLVSVRDGRIEVEPAPRAVRVVKKGRVFVAVPLTKGEALSADTVRETRDRLRRGRDA